MQRSASAYPLGASEQEHSMSTEPQFLGLDASTQSLKASLLSSNLDVLRECAINFDADLPAYKTKGGVMFGPQGSGEVYSPVQMIVEAMDVLMEKMRGEGWDFSRVRGVSAAGQQHASVYWSAEAGRLLSSVDGSQPLAAQLTGAFSRPIVPNWQDSSTTAECRQLESALGGAGALARATGSKAHERFTGAQIMRFRRLDPAAYAATARVSLVSSLITTLLCLDGEVKGIDESDACGMNLWQMDTLQRGWDRRVVEAIAGGAGAPADDLEAKLGRVETDGGRVVGHIGQWFVQRYGFDPECAVFPGTGDNPATFLSLTLRPDEGLISLGTSDVVLVSTKAYNPHPEFHAFFHPAQIAPLSKQDVQAGIAEHGASEPLKYFNMLVYKNGSLAREHVRDQYYGKDWDAFNRSVEQRRPTGGEGVPNEAAFWWLLPDIIPDGAHGVLKYTNTASGAASAQPVDEFSDRDSNALRMLESQFLNYRARSSAILSSPELADAIASGAAAAPHLTRVYATGGAAKNPTICSLAADVLSAPICKNVEYDPATESWGEANWNACSVGAAYKARWGWERTLPGRASVRFDQFVQACRDRRRMLRAGRHEERGGQHNPAEDEVERLGDVAEGISIVAKPGKGSDVYDQAVDWWRQMEHRALADSRKSQA